MSQRVEKLAILFADICGSTLLYENLGDDAARRLIFKCISTMTDKIFAYQGKLIKTIGDEVMATFPSAEAAFHSACAIMTAVARNQPGGENPLHIRIGFNYGEVITESDDVFGNTVNIASRVESITRADQIMTTQAVFDALPENLQRQLRRIMRADFKGKHDLLDIYQVVFAQEDTLSTRIGMPAYRKSSDMTDELILRYRGGSVRVNNKCRSVVLGRDDTCDLVVHNDLASRLHVHIDRRFGKFIVVDQSTNGTYIRFNDGNVTHITREEVFLQGSGLISLGQSFAENPSEVVEYSILPANPLHRHAG